MKLTALALLLSLSSAHASYYTMTCSNASGSVWWEEGHNSNTARLVYTGFITGTLERPMEHLNVELETVATIREDSLRDCEVESVNTEFIARARITPSEAHPETFLSYFPGNEIRATVICEKVVVERRDCPQNN
jgi:hypothetical protein